ncbi:GIY-YIG nuclease family protein [Novosphingobium sp. NDB2Meth1]|uniref:GIY-YIG nuclease family protein n=1 Tax=Novosphingobium sp. NDB2Meth1 TaxID=1892847 RepID=UPI0009310EE2|nr:GIY-YIG nuclease family protein [Novosphingobium sp. NDB2Meth1]
MTDPMVQDLYVMQNEFGCIKIGRSIDPWRRVHALRQSEHCRVELIAAFEGGGEDEEAMHIELDAHRLEGEWFDGCDEARKAVSEIFGSEHLEWKFEHDPVGRERWLTHLRVSREASAIRSVIARVLEMLRRAKEGSYIFDSYIFFCRFVAEHGRRPALIGAEKNGRSLTLWRDPETEDAGEVPAYTSSIDLALLAWPDDCRPTSWEGTVIDCCIEALIALRKALPKVPRMAGVAR